MECEERKGALRLKRTVARQGRGLFPRADKRLHALFKQRRGRKLKVSAFFSVHQRQGAGDGGVRREP